MPETSNKKPLGIYVEHRFRKTNWLYLVMVWKKPFIDKTTGKPKSRFCPLCQTLHFTKTVHLDLVEGRAIVSKGVLDELRMAGLPDLDITGTTKTPPPLKTGGTHVGSRPAQNLTNRSILTWQRYKPKSYIPKIGVSTDAVS